MTIGEKISYLRIKNKISQEQLAEKLCVSRQSVSKWEMDQSVPQIDKILQICDLFSVSADNLLRPEIVMGKSGESAAPRNKYFGTDGFRGEANVTLTSDQAYRVGRFLGWYFASPLCGCRQSGYKPRIVIGKDTRRSSYNLEYAIVAGLTASGADVYMLHVTTTPSVSYITRQDEFDCGIMITASHDPFYDNGIKVINRYGEKIDDVTASLIEAYIDGDLARLDVTASDLPLAKREDIGCIVDYVAGRNRYVGYLISLASHSYRQLRIGLDCANGASWMIAKAVFDALGAQTHVIGASPDGVNVNLSCGSTHPEALCEYVKEKHLDVGFAFDGDADRCIAVDENGEVVDGDKILYILATRMKARGILDGNTMVATEMTNEGLIRSLEKSGVRCVRTAVGDRFVFEKMEELGYRLGGEQTGHIILRKYATTGDGILTAIMLTEEMRDSKLMLSKLSAPVRLFPRAAHTIRVTDADAAAADIAVRAECSRINAELGSAGRALVHPNEAKKTVDILVECEHSGRCSAYADRLLAAVRESGFAAE